MKLGVEQDNVRRLRIERDILAANDEQAQEPQLPLSANCCRTTSQESRHLNDRCTSRPARGLIQPARPEWTLNLWLQSVGNVSVTCRLAKNHVEGQLTDPVNSHCGPTRDARPWTS